MITVLVRALRIAASILCLVFIGVAVGLAQLSVTTWHYNNARTGANTNEKILTTLNVNSTQFGKLFTQPVDGAVIGQALYLPGVKIPGVGVHNVIYVVTMHNSVYAFDADNAEGTNAAPLWHTSFLINGATTIPGSVQKCASTTKWTEVGIVSTPVIDPVSKTLYAVAKTYENATFVHRLHALDATTGLEKTGSPIVITASFTNAGKTSIFADAMQVNRPALLLEKGSLYIAFGSNGCRGSTEQGWVVAYKASTLQPQGAFDDEPDSSGSAIWMRGGGLSSDPVGNVYGATGDGDFAAGTNFGQSVLKFSQAGGELQLADWFTPYNERILDKNDLDMSEPVLILPSQGGKYHHLMAAVGKEGTIYILNRDNMGHFCDTCTAGDTQIMQELPAIAPETGALIYWNQRIYTSAPGMPIKALALTKGTLDDAPVAQSQTTSQGHSPVLSANGTTSGILWTVGTSLIAYDALSLVRLYNSALTPNNRDSLPVLPHFANLLVVNGKVYVGTNNSVVVFGLF